MRWIRRKCVASSLLLGTAMVSSGRSAIAVTIVGTRTMPASISARRRSAVQRILTLHEPRRRVDRRGWRSLDVERQRLQEELHANDDRQDREQDRAGTGDNAGLRRDEEVPRSPDTPEKGEERTAQDVERHRAEVANEVLDADPSQEAAEQLRGELERRSRLGEVTLRTRVARGDVHVPHHRAQETQVQEHARLEEEAARDAPVVEKRDDRGVNRGVAVRRIEDPPVPRRELREERQARVTEATTSRHRLELALVEEPVALCVVGLADDDRRDQREQVLGIHLPVRVDLGDDLGAERRRAAVSREHGRTDALL